MIATALAVVLAAAVTVAEGGMFFQPALSPDGSKVAYAADSKGQISIWVRSASGEGPAIQVATLGFEPTAHRLAARALLHRPWSADGRKLLFLNPERIGRDVHERLYVVDVEGGAPIPVGPEQGLVESAAWVGGTKLVFAHRTSKIAEEQSIELADVATSGAPQELFRYRKSETVVDLAPSPDGKWLAMLQLSGPRDARVRQVRILDLISARETGIEYTHAANFLTWATDSSRLFYLDTSNREARSWVVEDQKLGPVVAKGLLAIVAIEGHLLGLDGRGTLAAHPLSGEGKAKDLATGFVPVHAAGGKVALLRQGAAGSAVVVTTTEATAIAAGDIGLPRAAETTIPAGSAPETPKAPEGGSAAPQAQPAASGAYGG